MLFRFPIFGGLPGRGVLSRIKAILDAHSVALDNVEGEDGISVRKNWKGGLTIGAGSSSGLSGQASYNSYFKVYDASSGGVLKIGVKDGGDSQSEQCGAVIINGSRKSVENGLSEEITASGCAWLMSWVEATDIKAEIVFTNWTKDPDPPAEGIIYAAKLLGRWTYEAGDPPSISSINQDYLSGGEHLEILWSRCEPAET